MLLQLSIILRMQTMRLRYTPRKFALHPEHKTLVIVEADHAAVPLAQRQSGANGTGAALAQVGLQFQSILVANKYIFLTVCNALLGGQNSPYFHILKAKLCRLSLSGILGAVLGP